MQPEPAAMAAVCSAEALVSDTWIRLLIEAEDEARLTVDKFRRIADRLAQQIRTALEIGDRRTAGALRRRLRDATWGGDRAAERHRTLQMVLVDEIGLRAEATRWLREWE